MKPLGLAIMLVIGLVVGWIAHEGLSSREPAGPSGAPAVVEAHQGGGELIPARPSAGSARTPVISQSDTPTETSSASATIAKPSLRDAFSILDEAFSLQVPNTEEGYRLKYAGLSKEEMLIAAVALRSKRQVETDRISAELFSQGRFETQVVPEGQKALTPQTSKEEPVVSFGFQIEPGNGYSTVKVAKIDSAEYPEFDALKQEVRWLDTYLQLQDLQEGDQR